MPRRSVTRFFIPLIDVLTLLFCIFLLMPLVEAPAGHNPSAPAASADEVEQLKQELARLRQQHDETPERLREELDRLRREKGEVLQERLAVRVLEIDPQTGHLLYHDPGRAEIGNEAEALALIERDRKALAGRPAELFYLLLYPRQLTSPFPLRRQREQYDRWFRDVPHGWDVPGQAPGRKGSP
jgi:hypothetical protein